MVKLAITGATGQIGKPKERFRAAICNGSSAAMASISNWMYCTLRNIANSSGDGKCGIRLSAVGIPLETRKVLLGHRNGDIRSHYSAPEIEELLAAVDRVCEVNPGKIPSLTILNRKTAWRLLSKPLFSN